jgi:hypothetical protein
MWRGIANLPSVYGVVPPSEVINASQVIEEMKAPDRMELSGVLKKQLYETENPTLDYL